MLASRSAASVRTWAGCVVPGELLEERANFWAVVSSLSEEAEHVVGDVLVFRGLQQIGELLLCGGTQAFPAVVVANRLVGPRPQPEDDGHVIREVEAVVVRQVQEGVEPAGVSPSVVVFPSDASCEVVRY